MNSTEEVDRVNRDTLARDYIEMFSADEYKREIADWDAVSIEALDED